MLRSQPRLRVEISKRKTKVWPSVWADMGEVRTVHDGISLNDLPAYSQDVPTTLFLYEQVAREGSSILDRFRNHLWRTTALVSAPT